MHICVCVYTSNNSIYAKVNIGWAVYREQDHVEIGSGRQLVMVAHMHGRECIAVINLLHTLNSLFRALVLGDSQTGCFSKFDIYCGKGSSSEKNLATREVKSLTESLKGKFHHVYFDNFFTSEKLMME